MNILSRVWHSIKAAINITGVHPQDPELARLWGYHESATSGERVTAETALGLAVYFNCIRVISEDVAKLPFQVFRRNGQGRDLDTEHPVYRILHDEPNEETTSMAFRESMTADALSMGNSYAEIMRTGGGVAAGLVKLETCRVRVTRDERGEIVYEVYEDSGPPKRLRKEDVLHLHGLGGDSLMGWSVLRYAMESLGLGLAQQRYGAAFFGNGAAPRVAVEVPGRPDPATINLMRETWQREHAGPKKAGSIAFLPSGIKLHTYSIAPEEAQFLESRQFTVEEVCRWFRVPPHKVQHLLRATFSNIEHSSIEYVTDTLHPWLVRWEQECNRKLFRPAERKEYYSEHNADALLRGDSQSRATFYQQLSGIGVLNVNEIRAKENLPGIGPDGDKRFIPLNMTTLDKAGQEVATVERPQQPEPPEDDDEEDDDAIGEQIRGVLADALERMIRKESEAMRRAANKPDSFIRSFEDFYARHAELVKEAVLPACRVWVLWSERGNAEALASEIATEHCDRSAKELMDCCEVIAAQLPAAVETLCDTWSGRATQDAERYFGG